MLKREEYIKNTEILKEVMDPSKYYRLSEIINLLKEKEISDEQIDSICATLGYIMDGINVSDYNNPIEYNTLFKRKKVNLAKTEITSHKDDKSEIVNANIISSNGVQLNYSSQRVQYSEYNNAEKLNNGQNSDTIKNLLRYSIFDLGFQDIELLHYIFYVEQDFSSESEFLSIAEMERIILSYNNTKHIHTNKISPTTARNCINTLNKMIKSNYSGIHNINDHLKVLRYESGQNYNTYYFYYDTEMKCFYVPKSNTQKYYRPIANNFSYIQYEPSQIDKLQMLIFALKDYKKAYSEEEIRNNLKELVDDQTLTEDIMFELFNYVEKGQKFIKSYDANNTTYQISSLSYTEEIRYYGYGLYKMKMKHIDDMIRDYLYENMKVLIKCDGRFFSSYQAIPTKFIYILYGTYCAMDYRQTDLKKQCNIYKSSWEYLDNQSIFDLEIATAITDIEDLLLMDDKYQKLSDVYRQITDTPTAFINIEDLKNKINLLNYSNDAEEKVVKLRK